MTAYENMLNDEEIAAVVSYVRTSFGNNAGAVDAATVTRVRKEAAEKKGFYSPEELKKEFPAF
jgi:mono/diheme cytochrome c family protein